MFYYLDTNLPPNSMVEKKAYLDQSNLWEKLFLFEVRNEYVVFNYLLEF